MNPGHPDSWTDEPRIISLSKKYISRVDVIKTLDDPILGTLYLGSFVYDREVEIQYTYIKKFEREQAAPQAALWQVIKSCHKKPERGFIPRILAYSTNGDPLRGYLDKFGPQDELRDEFIGSEDQELLLRIGDDRVRELYFEPLPETLKTLLLKRSRDRIPFEEREILLFLICSLKTLVAFSEESLIHPPISLSTVVPTPSAYYLYHPLLHLAGPFTPFDQVASQSKHYLPPEMVDLIIECTSPEEFETVKNELDQDKISVFGLGLVALEMATLVEEEEWYTEECQFKRDVLEVKRNMVRERYSPRLVRVIEAMISNYKVRPNSEGLLKLMRDEREEVKNFQRLLEREDQEKTVEEQNKLAELLIHNPDTVNEDFQSDRVQADEDLANERSVSDIGSIGGAKLAPADNQNRKNIWSDKKSIDLKKGQEDPMSSPIAFTVDRLAGGLAKVPLPGIFPEPVRQFDSMLYPLPSQRAPAERPLIHESPSKQSDKPAPEESFRTPSTIYPTVGNNIQYQGNQFLPQATTTQQFPSNLPYQAGHVPSYTYSGAPVTFQTTGNSSMQYNNNDQNREVGPGRLYFPGNVYRTNQVVNQGYASPSKESIDPFVSGTGQRVRTFESFRPIHEEVRPPVLVREDRSRSPRLVSVKRYMIRDGQKILIDEENFGENHTYVKHPVLPAGLFSPTDKLPTTPTPFTKITPIQTETQTTMLPVTRAIQEPLRLLSDRKNNFASVQRPSEEMATPLLSQAFQGKFNPVQTPIDRSSSPFQSKIHNLNNLAKGLDCHPFGNNDFFQVAKEINDKLDELIHREKAHEKMMESVVLERSERAEKARVIDNNKSLSSKSKDRRVHLRETKENRRLVSDETQYEIDLSDVQCCKKCRKYQKDKNGELFSCCHKPSKPIPRTPPQKSRSHSPIIPTQKRHLDQRHESDNTPVSPTVCPRYYRAISPTPKTLFPLPQNESELKSQREELKKRGELKQVQKELMDAEKIRQIRENLKVAQEKRKKHKEKENKNEPEGRDNNVWARRLQEGVARRGGMM